MSQTMSGYGVVVPKEKFGKITGAPRPTIGPLDVMAEPVAMSACTSDVHQVHAGLPAGLILGHEVVGRIVKVGSDVKRFKVGDVVAVGAVTPDWMNQSIQDNIHQHAGGMNQGMNWCVTENGTFAEYFRIRQADMNATLIPKGLNYEHAILAADMVTTGFHGAELANIQFGDTVVCCGIGPVGLMAVAGAALRGAGRIVAIGRRTVTKELAKFYGATDFLNYEDGPIDEQVRDLLGDKDVDAVIFSGGDADAFARSINMVKANGVVSNLAAHDFDVNIPMMYSYMFCAHKKINGGLCPGGSRRLDRLFEVMLAGRLDPTQMVTHRFDGLDGIAKAYDLMDMEKKQDDFAKAIVKV